MEFCPLELAEWVQGSWRDSDMSERIKGFCFDTRKIREGDCFLALSHGIRDGHDFIDEAIKNGAIAAIVERPVEFPIPQLIVSDTVLALGALGSVARSRFKGSILGITGSCGKTSTKDMLKRLLGESRTHATAGNWNNRIGVPMTLSGLGKQKFAVIEAGINEPGEMELIGQMIRADWVVVTGIGAAHLEKLGSLDRVAREKSELIRQARPHVKVVLPFAAYRMSAFREFAGCSIVLAEENESVLPEPDSIIRYSQTACGVKLFDTDFPVESASCGIRSNAALAITVAHRLGVPLEVIRKRMIGWQPAADRGRIIHLDRQTFYIDCYNANPSSMLDALSAFKTLMREELPRGYILGVMDELGTSAAELHRKVGEALQLRKQDRVWLVGGEDRAIAYRSGIESRYFNQVILSGSVKKIKSDVAQFKGALFLKGSRSCRLEQFLPESFNV